jgi:hypothetical protein
MNVHVDKLNNFKAKIKNLERFLNALFINNRKENNINLTFILSHRIL